MGVHIYNTHVDFFLKVGSHISQARLKLSMLSRKTLEFLFWGWRNDSAVKNTDFSFRGPSCNSQLPQWKPTPLCNSSSRVSHTPFQLPFFTGDMWHTDIHVGKIHRQWLSLNWSMCPHLSTQISQAYAARFMLGKHSVNWATFPASGEILFLKKTWQNTHFKHFN